MSKLNVNEIFSYFSRATFWLLQRFAQHSSAAYIPPLWLSDAVSLFMKWRLFCITDNRMIARGEVAPISVEDTPQSLTFVQSLQSKPQLIRSLDTVFFKKLINGIINRRTWSINMFCVTVSAVSLPGSKEANAFSCRASTVAHYLLLWRLRCRVGAQFTHTQWAWLLFLCLTSS